MPTGKVVAEFAVDVKFTKPQLSVAEGARQMATAPAIVGLVVAKTFAGQFLILACGS